jgi:hypothetical protein
VQVLDDRCKIQQLLSIYPDKSKESQYQVNPDEYVFACIHISSTYCPSKEKNTLVLTVAQLTAQMEDERRFYQMQIESLKEERRLILQDFDVKYQQFQDEVNTIERHKQDLHKAFTQLTTGN